MTHESCRRNLQACPLGCGALRFAGWGCLPGRRRGAPWRAVRHPAAPARSRPGRGSVICPTSKHVLDQVVEHLLQVGAADPGCTRVASDLPTPRSGAMVYTLFYAHPIISPQSLDHRSTISRRSVGNHSATSHSRPQARNSPALEKQERLDMADETLTRLKAKARETHVGRSEAYSWLRAKFEHLHPLLTQRRLAFQQIADDLVASGKRGGRGKPMTVHAARQIWRRVQRDVATEEPWRMDAARTCMQEGWSAQKPRRREPERGKDADRPPPVVTAPAPRPPVPSYPSPVLPPPKPLLQPAIASRPHEELSEEEREAYAKAQILRLRRRFAEASGHDPDEVR